jgi:hypothetical protein
MGQGALAIAISTPAGAEPDLELARLPKMVECEQLPEMLTLHHLGKPCPGVASMSH